MELIRKKKKIYYLLVVEFKIKSITEAKKEKRWVPYVTFKNENIFGSFTQNKTLGIPRVLTSVQIYTLNLVWSIFYRSVISQWFLNDILFF